ncbi:MAG: peptidoglycan bridge formation glycyltransferase FemA/FemB family protein [bacterium]|nr:peptidoglycan bridge formation glycyltransferase FemA/FemB family protein [bacterium]
MQLKILEDTDREEFNKLASHPVQSWEWGEFRRKTGNEVLRIGVYEGDSLKEVHQLTVHPIPHSRLKLAVLLKGPFPSAQTLKLLKVFAKEQNLLFIRMEPLEAVSVKGQGESELKKLGLVPGKRFFTPSTFVVDLDKTEEELLANMHPKTRYNIRVAEKHGVEVKEETSEKAFNEYLKLTAETTRRQGFYAHGSAYHKLMWEALHPAGIAHLLVARYQNEPLITWLLFAWKDTLYYPYGASSETNRNVMASYKMMWEAIKFGKNLGLKKFDLWGREEGKGFSKFKEGFSPEVVEFIGTWDLVVNNTVYRAYRIAEELRWKLLKIKAKLSPGSSFK